MLPQLVAVPQVLPVLLTPATARNACYISVACPKLQPGGDVGGSNRLGKSLPSIHTLESQAVA